MKKIENYKNIVLVVFACYVVLFSFLLIKQSYKLNKKLETTIINSNQYDGLVAFDNYINDKKNLVEKYKKTNNKNISDECLDKISSEVDIIYFKNHGINTYSDLFSYYQNIYDNSVFLKMTESCLFKENEINELWKYNSQRISLIEDEFYDVLSLYQITLDDNELEEIKKELEMWENEFDSGVLSRIRKVDKLYIEKLFEILGDRYE